MLNLKKLLKWKLPTQNSGENQITNNKNYSNGFSTETEIENLGDYWENIKDTPFFIHGNEKTGYKAIMGKYQITETFQTPKEVEKYVVAKGYTLLITIMQCVLEFQLEQKGKEPDKNSEISN